MANATLTKGTKVFVSSTPQPDNLTKAEFEALTWVPVCCPTSAPSLSQEAEIVTEFCIDGTENIATGAASGMETEMTVLYKADCEGQDIMRESFEGQPYAYKKEYADSPNPTTTTNSIIYARALVTNLPDNDGGVNDFIAHTYNMKIVQPPILVKPEAI